MYGITRENFDGETVESLYIFFFVARSAIGAIHRKPSLTNSPSQSRAAPRADRLEGGD